MVVPIYRKDEEKAQVMETASKMAADLGAHLDTREGQSPGAKFFHWERRGVPVVCELGPRDVASGKTVIKRRDTGTKEVIGQEEAKAKLSATLQTMQTDLLVRARQRLKDNTVLANSIEEVEGDLAFGYWPKRAAES